MIKVGCSCTKAARKELNSEYRRCTSTSCPNVTVGDLKELMSTYPRLDLVDDVAPIWTFARIRNYNLQLWILIKYLLQPAVVPALLRLIARALADGVLVFSVAKVGAGEKLGRVVCRGV